MGVVPASRGQDVVVDRGVRNLLADVNRRAVNDGDSGPIHETIDERCIRILIDLLESSRGLSGWLSPVVIFHRYHEDCRDLLCTGARAAPVQSIGPTNQR